MSENIEMKEKGLKSLKSYRKQYTRLSTKRKIKFFLRLFIVLLCTTGVIVQITQLLLQYLNGDTVVNIKIEQIQYNKIPAITICYPRFLSMERVVQKYQNLEPIFEKYKNTIENVKEEDYKNNETITQYMNDMYFDNFSKYVENLELSVTELFQLSIPFEFPRNSSKYNKFKSNSYSIEIKAKGIRLFWKNQTLSDIEVEDTEPIESIVLPDFRQGFKCFTFFHHLNKKWREFQIDLKELFIQVYHNENWFPPPVFDKSVISFAMHSPNAMPQQMTVNHFMRLKAGRWYEMTYNRLKTVLLPPNYKTMCRDYDLDDKQDYRLRSDCVNHCIYEEISGKCSQCIVHMSNRSSIADTNCTECIYRSESIWRRDMFENDLPTKICPNFGFGSFELKSFSTEALVKYNKLFERRLCISNNLSRVNSECQEKCQNECTNRFYNYEVKSREKMSNVSEWNKKTKIILAHNQLPDQITQHIAEMSFIQFAANFGGLMGMWMGLSALAVLDFIMRLV